MPAMLKKKFHKIRDSIRYLRSYKSIKEIENLLKQHQVLYFNGHFGDNITDLYWNCSIITVLLHL